MDLVSLQKLGIPYKGTVLRPHDSFFRNSGPNTRWLLEPDTSSGSVQTIDNYDITGDGVKDLIIGRHDGNIEVYAYDEGDDSEPVLKYSHVTFWSVFGFIGIYFCAFSVQNCGESISSVEGGVVGSAGYDEIIASTYTGKPD